MRLAQARAMVPHIQLAEANPEADAKALNALARWLVRYSPLVALDGADGLLIDSTGCAHLFGGENTMLNDIKGRLKKAGITAQLSIAENRAAARALARYRPGTISTSKEETQKILASLPVQALRLTEGMTHTLYQLGLKTIGHLTSQPRPALARRFRGKPSKDVTALLARLDQIAGRKDEPISPLSPLPNWQVRQAFAEPVGHMEAIEYATASLIEDLCLTLMKAERGARRLDLSAFRVDGSVQTLTIGTSRASRDKAHLMRLFTEKLDTLEAGFGFDLLILAVRETEKLSPSQIGDTREETAQSTANLLDRLATRLGPGSVCVLKHRHSHLPERAQTFAPVSEATLGWQYLQSLTAPRPIRLLMHPETIEVLAEIPEGPPRRFRWRRKEHRVLKAEGPERIAPEWWIDPADRTRDYYRVEVASGARFWLFRHGLYSSPGLRVGEASTPDWYLHGFFA